MEKASNAKSSPSADSSSPSKSLRSAEVPALERLEPSSAKKELPRNSQRAHSARLSPDNNADKISPTSRDTKSSFLEENSLNLPELNPKSDSTSI